MPAKPIGKSKRFSEFGEKSVLTISAQSENLLILGHKGLRKLRKSFFEGLQLYS
jgi:hypothetical protein